jgi:xanthine dehydrogenase iron-sulfur cluster and FAD-binding subunit A
MVSDRRACIDWAHCIKDLVDIHYPDAEQIVLVQRQPQHPDARLAVCWPSTPLALLALRASNLAAADIPLSNLEIRERMSGNVCHCGAYSGIVAAIEQAAGLMRSFEYVKPTDFRPPCSCQRPPALPFPCREHHGHLE